MRMPTEPPDLAETDEGAAEDGEGLVDVGLALVARGEATHAVQAGAGGSTTQRLTT